MNEYLLTEHAVLNAHSLVCTCLVEKLRNMQLMLPEFVICLAEEYVVLAPRTVGTAKTVLGCYQGGEPLGLQIQYV